MRFVVLMVMKKSIMVSWFVMPYGVKSINVSEEHAASIFRAEVRVLYRVRRKGQTRGPADLHLPS
jgi:hypothetical protein